MEIDSLSSPRATETDFFLANIVYLYDILCNTAPLYFLGPNYIQESPGCQPMYLVSAERNKGFILLNCVHHMQEVKFVLSDINNCRIFLSCLQHFPLLFLYCLGSLSTNFLLSPNFAKKKKKRLCVYHSLCTFHTIFSGWKEISILFCCIQ